MHKAFEAFTSKMQASLEETPLPIEQEALKALQAAAALEADEVYSRRAVGESSCKFRLELTETINRDMSALSEENITLSEQSCDALLIQLFNRAVQPKLSDDGTGYTSVEEVRSDFADIREVDPNPNPNPNSNPNLSPNPNPNSN
jgi:hypothetical protein